MLAGEPVRDELKRLIAPGVTMGGARPKALIELDGQPWVIKFAETGEAQDWPLIEHAAMTLAARAGITVAPTRALALARGHAVAVQRFDRCVDRDGRTQRLHALSAHVALRAAGEEMGYPELAQLLRRRGVVRDGVSQAQMRELFRRMVFNILIDNALSEANLFGLGARDARDEVRTVAAVVDAWRDHFNAVGCLPPISTQWQRKSTDLIGSASARQRADPRAMAAIKLRAHGPHHTAHQAFTPCSEAGFRPSISRASAGDATARPALRAHCARASISWPLPDVRSPPGR